MGFMMTLSSVKTTGNTGLSENFRGESVVMALAESYTNLSDSFRNVKTDNIVSAMQVGNKPLTVSNDVGVITSSTRATGRGETQHGLS